MELLGMASLYKSKSASRPKHAEPAVATEHFASPLAQAGSALEHGTPVPVTGDDCFDALAQASGQVVWIALADGTLVDAPQWRALTGQTSEQARGSGWLDAIHLDDRPRVERMWEEAVATELPFELDYRVHDRDGTYRPFAVRAVPVRGPDGRVRVWV